MRKLLTAALAALTLAGCATATLNTGDQRRAVVLAPFVRPVGLTTISVPEGAVLYAAQVGGQAAWCSTTPAWFAAGGEARPVCFFDPQGGQQAEGWLKTAYVTGTLSAARLDVDIPYRVTAGPALPPRP